MEHPAYGAKYRNKTYFKLTQNYRSHQGLFSCLTRSRADKLPIAILEYSSKLFYNGELVPCADRAITNSLLHWEGFEKNSRFPILFHSVIGEDSREARSPSFFNAAEASQVKSYVEQLCGEMKMRGEDIGVISPYNAQVGKIRKLLMASKTAKTTESDQNWVG